VFSTLLGYNLILVFISGNHWYITFTSLLNNGLSQSRVIIFKFSCCVSEICFNEQLFHATFKNISYGEAQIIQCKIGMGFTKENEQEK